jgi:hypothetical protein
MSPGGLPEVSRRSPEALPLRGQEKNIAVRAGRKHLLRMPMSKKELHSFRVAIKRGPDRSPLYWWLVEQYHELTGDGSSRRQDWTDHCKRMARLGVVDANGKPPNIEAARKAWQVVRKEVAAERARRLAPIPRERSTTRNSSLREPPLAALPWAAPEARAGPLKDPAPDEELPQRQPSSVTPVQPPIGTPGPSAPEELSPEVKAKFDKLRRQFAETDRKRFGSF